MLVTQSCLTLCNSMDCSPLGSSVHGILQARIPGWVAIPFSRGSSWPRDWSRASHIVGSRFTLWATSTLLLAKVYGACLRPQLLYSSPPLCDPMDCSLLGYSAHGILQARILECVAVPSSRGSSQPRNRTQSAASQADFFFFFFTIWATLFFPSYRT